MTDLFEGPITSEKEYLNELVGEGKKFKTTEDLARGKYEADHMIEIFKKQQDALREDYNRLKSDYEARAKLEELVDQLNNPPSNTTTGTQPKATEVAKPLDHNEFKEMIRQTVGELQTRQQEEQNVKHVMETLKERYGANYTETLNKQIEELGLTKEYVNSLARTSPKAVIKTLGLDVLPKQEPFLAPPRSTAFQPTAAKKRTWSYYQELKKADPNTYYDPKTTVQMEKDYLALGADFEDGDFRRYGDSAFA